MQLLARTSVPDTRNNSFKALEGNGWPPRILCQMRLLSRNEGKFKASSETQRLYVLYTFLERVIIPM